MKKTLLLSTLAVLAIFSFATFSVASTGQGYIPSWVDCRGAHPHGNIEIGAAVGQNTAVVSWTSPPSDWEKSGNCVPVPLESTTMIVYVSDSPYNPVPAEVICHSSSCSDGFSIMVQYCAIPTKYGCSEYLSRPYNLQYNNHIVVELTIQYLSGEAYFGAYTMAVTS